MGKTEHVRRMMLGHGTKIIMQIYSGKELNQKFHIETGKQAVDLDHEHINPQRLPMDDNDRITEIIRQALRSGPLDQSLEDVSINSFTPSIRHVRKPPDFSYQ